jgi:hypothetical protein
MTPDPNKTSDFKRNEKVREAAGKDENASKLTLY